MKQYIKNKIIKSKLTMKGEHISESEKKQFISFLTRLNHVSIVFRCLGNEYIYKQYNTSIDNIPILSEFIFLYGDKAKLFYEKLDNRIHNLYIDDTLNGTMEFIYNKIQKVFVQLNLKSEKTKEKVGILVKKNPVFLAYWRHMTKEKWLNEIANLSKLKKVQLKDYYVALLHTVGLAGYGRNSYFLSTSESYNIEKVMGLKQKYIELVGWASPKLGVFSKSRFNKTADVIKQCGFPVVDGAVFPEQKEITLKCGLLPHFIIGYFYEGGFEVNPAIFDTQDYSHVVKKGVVVNQSSFSEKIKNMNYRSTFLFCDDIYFQID